MGYENVPRYQRVTIPQDIALLNNSIHDKGLQDAYFDELEVSLRRHAKDELASDGIQRCQIPDEGRVQIRRIHLNRSGAVQKEHVEASARGPSAWVFIGELNPAPSLFDSVQPDLEQTILDALDELMDAGNRPIGFIGGFM